MTYFLTLKTKPRLGFLLYTSDYLEYVDFYAERERESSLMGNKIL